MRSHIDFSIASEERKRVNKKLCYSQPYGGIAIGSLTMNQLIFLTIAFLVLCSDSIAGEFLGRRSQSSPGTSEERQILIEQLSNFIDQQARKKFQQQMHFQNHLHHQQQKIQHSEIPGPGFTFELPPPILKENNENNEIQFAVPPFDSRYYEQNLQPVEDDEIAIDDAPAADIAVTTMKNKILIPSPMHVVDSQSSEINSRILHRAQQKQQQQQLQKNQRQENDVLQKPLQNDFDNTTSLYIVALIAGLSCAFSTGLIALGLMYWTLKKKVKSADACDYASCDYGVVGPRSMKNNLDPQVAAGDKKLAHSAQMFHYQHQKNQLIAMENRNGAAAELSHVDDQDNDSDENENDFTVYECPGLADFSHNMNMEVKNPLFSEETPAATTKAEKTQSTSKQQQ